MIGRDLLADQNQITLLAGDQERYVLCDIDTSAAAMGGDFLDRRR